MKPYGQRMPFQTKKSGWCGYCKERPLTEDDLRCKRWDKRLARRVGKYLAEEQLRDVDPAKIHV